MAVRPAVQRRDHPPDARGRGPAALKRETPGEADPLEHVPGLRRFTVAEPGSNAQSVSRLYDAFEDAESKRHEWRSLMKEGKRGAASRYFQEHRDESLSAATEEETRGEPGVLRQHLGVMRELAAARREVEGAGRDDSVSVARV